jgi:hypothetical protein
VILGTLNAGIAQAQSISVSALGTVDRSIVNGQQVYHATLNVERGCCGVIVTQGKNGIATAQFFDNPDDLAAATNSASAQAVSGNTETTYGEAPAAISSDGKSGALSGALAATSGQRTINAKAMIYYWDQFNVMNGLNTKLTWSYNGVNVTSGSWWAQASVYYKWTYDGPSQNG